jgi:hypothetical protein
VTERERELLDEARSARVEAASPTELQVLADLHDRGKLTDDEFAQEKERILGSRRPVPA